MLRLYRELLAIRRNNAALSRLDLQSLETHADEAEKLLFVRRWSDANEVLVVFHFGEKPATADLPFEDADWRPLLDTGALIEARRLTIPPHSFGVWSATRTSR